MSHRFRTQALLTLVLLAGCDSGNVPSHGDASTVGDATFTGRVLVVDGSERVPLEGALVEVAGAQTRTDSLGRFELSGLAATRVVAHVTGPSADVALDPRVYGTRELPVELRSGESESRVVTLLPGCVRALGGSEAVSIDLEGCGASGTLELPAHAFVDAGGAAHDGPAVLEIVVLDPSEPAAILGAPSADEGQTLRAYVEVRPRDALTGAPLQLAPGATATLRLPASDGDLTATSVWRPASASWEPHASEARRIDAATVELTTTHFTAFAVTGSPAPSACVRLRPQLCDASGCRPAAVQVDVVGVGASSQIVSGDACLRVPAGRDLVLELTYVNPLAAAILGTPMYAAHVVVGAGAAAACDGAACTELGTVTLSPLPSACLTGRLVTPDGAAVIGPVAILADGRRVGGTVLPAGCDGRFCLEVPVGAGALSLESSMGALALDAPTGATGGVCDRTMPMPAVACSASSASPVCSTASGTFSCLGTCAPPLRVTATESGTSGCAAGEHALAVTLSGGPTSRRFESFAVRFSDGALVASAHSVSSQHSLCVPDGGYDVFAYAYPRGGTIPLRAQTRVVVGSAGSTLTVIVDGTGRVTTTPSGIDCDTTCSAAFAPGSLVQLRAAGPDGLAIAVAWSGDCMGVDGTSSTPLATVLLDRDVTCRALFPRPRFYISIPPIGTQTPTSVFTVQPQAWDTASAAYRPVHDVVPDVTRCDWEVALDGVVRAHPSTTACAPLLFGPASVHPDVTLEVGNWQLTVTAYRADGTASEPASGGFGVF